MYSKSFLHELQRIQCDLSGGIKTLGQVEVMLSEECLPNHYSEMLHVIHTYIQGVHKDLRLCIQSYEQREF